MSKDTSIIVKDSILRLRSKSNISKDTGKIDRKKVNEVDALAVYFFHL